jgi:hypothetical protein
MLVTTSLHVPYPVESAVTFVPESFGRFRGILDPDVVARVTEADGP